MTMQAATSSDRRNVIRSMARGFIWFNAMIVVAALLFGLLAAGSRVRAAQEGTIGATTGGLDSGVALGAALSTGLSALGAGIAVGMTASAALGTIAERPESVGRALIFVGLAEGIAIYGLIMSFLIITS